VEAIFTTETETDLPRRHQQAHQIDVVIAVNRGVCIGIWTRRRLEAVLLRIGMREGIMRGIETEIGIETRARETSGIGIPETGI
jgi:hypothetical protein